MQVTLVTNLLTDINIVGVFKKYLAFPDNIYKTNIDDCMRFMIRNY